MSVMSVLQMGQASLRSTSILPQWAQEQRCWQGRSTHARRPSMQMTHSRAREDAAVADGEGKRADNNNNKDELKKNTFF